MLFEYKLADKSEQSKGLNKCASFSRDNLKSAGMEYVWYICIARKSRKDPRAHRDLSWARIYHVYFMCFWHFP